MRGRTRTGAVTGFAALSAALAIGVGAFAAHGATPAAAAVLKTGAAYQLVHAVAAVAVADRRVAWLLLIGAALFAGSLYLLAAGGPRLLGPVTPVGGLVMIAGWLLLAYRSFRGR